MKRTLFFLILVALVCSVSFAQMGIRTENASFRFRNYTGTSSQDTLKDLSYYKANLDSAAIKYLGTVTVNSAVAADSIFVWEATNPTGTRYLGKIIIPATSTGPVSLTFNCQIDSAYVIIKRYKTSDVTLTFRRGF